MRDESLGISGRYNSYVYDVDLLEGIEFLIESVKDFF